MALAPPLKYHGGKHYLAAKLIALMPLHLHYVETHFGGGAVLLAKDPSGVSEIVNDLSGELSNFWRVLQDEAAFRSFGRRIAATPFSEIEWQRSRRPIDLDGSPDVDAAIGFFIRSRQSRQGLGRDFATLSRNRVRSGMNEQASAWLTAVEGLAAVHERFRRVVILNRDALKVIRSQDGPNTLFYCDPPYIHTTRTVKDAYAHEMTDDQHRRLLRAVNGCEGAVMLSGYANPLYDQELVGWNRHDFRIDNKASGSATKPRVTESVWCNF